MKPPSKTYHDTNILHPQECGQSEHLYTELYNMPAADRPNREKIQYPVPELPIEAVSKID